MGNLLTTREMNSKGLEYGKSRYECVTSLCGRRLAIIEVGFDFLIVQEYDYERGANYKYVHKLRNQPYRLRKLGPNNRPGKQFRSGL